MNATPQQTSLDQLVTELVRQLTKIYSVSSKAAEIMIGQQLGLLPTVDKLIAELVTKFSTHHKVDLDQARTLIAEQLGVDAWTISLWETHPRAILASNATLLRQAGQLPGWCTEVVGQTWGKRLEAALLVFDDQPWLGPPVETVLAQLFHTMEERGVSLQEFVEKTKLPQADVEKMQQGTYGTLTAEVCNVLDEAGASYFDGPVAREWWQNKLMAAYLQQSKAPQ